MKNENNVNVPVGFAMARELTTEELNEVAGSNSVSGKVYGTHQTVNYDIVGDYIM